MKKLNQILREVFTIEYIKGSFFLVGGYGSGKTFVTRSAFGAGLKLVNSDRWYLRRFETNLSLKMN